MMLRGLILLGLGLCGMAAVATARQNPKPQLFPQPRSVAYQSGRVRSGRFWLDKLSVFVRKTVSGEVAFALNTFDDIVKQQTGRPIRRASSAASATGTYRVAERGGNLPDPTEAGGNSQRETYRIQVSPNGIRLNAQTPTGLFYAVQTLRQLIQVENGRAWLPCLTIEDAPALAFRGVMMDFAHGGLLTVDEIKRQLDFLARWKTNQYYFYNEVSIRLDGFPTLGYQGGYSKKQLQEIIAYGRQRHIDVIPFLNLYGHLHELIRQEQYADLAIGTYGHELDPRQPTVNALLKNWIKQYADLFPSPFIHVGFDETWETKRIADERSGIDAEKLWLQQLRFVENELRPYGKTVLAWTDMTHYYPDLLQQLPTGVMPVIWEYKPDTTEIYRYLTPVLREKRPFFIQPAVSGWGHLYPNPNYTFTNLDLCLRIGLQHGIKGYINSVWTDPVMPSICASWLFMAYGSIGAWQGQNPNKAQFAQHYAALRFPNASEQVGQAFTALHAANESLVKCLGANTNGLPQGTFMEMWANPFSAYYLQNTTTHETDFRQTRRLAEQAQGFLIEAIENANGYQREHLKSLLVTAQLMAYTCTRFLWAKTIRDRWNQAMLVQKKNDFVVYDLTYPAHGLLVDMMDENGSNKEAYRQAWLSEYQPYRLQTMLGRFEAEHAFWQKLQQKVNDYRIQHPPGHVATQSFEALFQPDF